MSKLRSLLVTNPLLASIKHVIISPFLGFIYIPLGKEGFIICPRHKVTLYSDYTGVWNLLEVFRDNSYERIVKIEKGDVVVDIGAHVGMFTKKALRESGKEGFVVAIEPEPRNLEILRKNTRGYTNVAIIRKAVGEKGCKTKLCLSKVSDRHSIKREYSEKVSNVIEVEMDTLANILSKLKMPNVDFVKIDVEGTELEVLKGAGEYLRGIKKIVIAAEHYPGEEKEVDDFLKSWGFLTKKMPIKGKWHVYGWR